MEFHPDSEKYPDIARAWFKETTKTVAPGASDKYIKMKLGKGHITRLYFKVDRARKMMKVLCYHFCDFASCTDEFVALYYNDMHEDLADTTTFGEWSFPTMPHNMADEYIVNADNTVFTSVNFGDPEVIKTGDITRNMT
jgi:hypothetical protein